LSDLWEVIVPAPALNLARRFWPNIEQLPSEVQISGIANVITVLYVTPLALVGLVWLVMETRWNVIAENWPFLLLIAVLMYILERLSFFLTIETGSGSYVNSEGSLDTVMMWSAILLFGPSAIWLGLFWLVVYFVELWSSSPATGDRWNSLRNLTMGTAVDTLCVLVSLLVYINLGGQFPIQGLNPVYVFPALVAMLVFFLMTLLMWSGFIIYVLAHRGKLIADSSTRPIIRLILLSLVLPNLANPFAILAAGLYVQNTIYMFFFLVVGLFLVAILARRLSMEAEFNRQRARQLEQLEKLGEDIINSPPDASNIPQILEKNTPSMFPGRLAIWVAGNQILLRSPNEWELDIQPIEQWLANQSEAVALSVKEPLPWDATQPARRPTVICPIYDNQDGRNIGGIYLEMRSIIGSWGGKELRSLFPPLHSLASQISSALHQAERYAETLEYEKINQELALAGRIQASFLPNRMPDLPGWQLAVTMLPARATSGDFFDFIPLSDGRLGLIIADVADKGIGPALYMALSRTLLRTFAHQFEDDPNQVLIQTNRRILSDARANLFVTLFYGILDWRNGILKFCNAGHNPPYLLSGKEGRYLAELDKTGIPIGIDPEAEWESHSAEINPGDVLVMYTDGITEAQDEKGNFFDEDLLIEAAEARLGRPAYEIQTSILESLQTFVGDFPQSDDITLMILARDLASHPDQPQEFTHLNVMRAAELQVDEQDLDPPAQDPLENQDQE
jgi:serine phosphatase RsbU (regulator of sigma subunit)